jgi:hypothetical protein
MKRLIFLWNNYCKQIEKYKGAMDSKKKVTAKIHKEMADKILDEYFAELEKEVID